jgi:ADP-heptose:LPS heptosyltransferase
VRGLGVTRERFEDVQRIAVLRGGGLGDLVFVLPGVEALQAAYPDAEITLLGTPQHAALLTGRASPVTDVAVLPATTGVGPDAGSSEAALPTEQEFVDRMQQRRFDLAVQVHGGGRYSNPFLLRLGARHTVGTATPDAVALERTLDYVYYQHEVLRALEVAGLAGAPPVSLEPQLELTDRERSAAASVEGRVLVVHPGASDPRRRWPVAAFAEVAAAVADRGVRVVVVGDATEAELAEEVVAQARRRGALAVESRAGAQDLSDLIGLLAGASVLLANDSGPRHLAQAIGTATVGVYWFGNVVNAASFSRDRHRLQIGWTTRCPVCGVDVTQVGWTAERCVHDPSYVAEVRPAAVLEDVLGLLAQRTGDSRRATRSK